MSTPKELLATPTTSKGNIRTTDSNVFSSPARDVGWSPGAANTPLGVLLYGSQSNSMYASQMLSHPSPIRHTSHFPLSCTDKEKSETTAFPRYNPSVEVDAKEADLKLENLEGYEPSKEARAFKPVPPPSTPQPLGTLFYAPLPKYSADCYMGYPYGGDKLNDHEDHCQSRENTFQLNFGKTDESEIYKSDIPLASSPSPISPPYYTTSGSPVKPRRVPIFPPPASPPLFAGYSPTSRHTYRDSEPERMVGPRDRRLGRTPPRSGVLASCHPSAEPLDDDPFLVCAVTATDSHVFSGSTQGYRSGLLEPLESTGAMHNVGRVSSSVGHQNYPTQTGPRGRMGILSSRSSRKKYPTSKSKAAPRNRHGAAANKFNLLSTASPLPHDLAQSSSFSFSHPYNTELQPQSGNGTSAIGYVPSDGYMDPSTPLNQLEIATSSYANPTSMARTLFATPSLTSSFGTPSTASIIPTPGYPTLSPSPDITTSPTIMRSTRSRNELARGRLMLGCTTLTPTVELDLIGKGKLAESILEYRNIHRTQMETRLSQNAESQELDMSGLDRSKAPVQTIPSPGGFVFEDTRHCVAPGLIQTSWDTLVHRPSFPPPTEYQDRAPTSSIRSTQGVPTERLFIDQLSKDIEESVNKGPQSKRVRDENDVDWTPTKTKRAKVLDESDVSLSPTKGGVPKEISDFLGLGRATRSQTHAAASLLALSSSGHNSSSKEDRTDGIGGHEVPDDEIPGIKTPITRRSSTRSKRQSQPTTRNVYKTPTITQRMKSNMKYGAAGRAPSRVGGAPSSGAIKTQSNTLTHTEERKDIIERQKSSCDSQSKEIPQTYDGEIEVGNVNPSQEADHVSTPKERPKVPSELLPRPDPSVVHGPDGKIVRRTFPEDLPIHESYPKWYRRNPVSAYFREEDPVRSFVFGERTTEIIKPIPRMVFNAAPHFNLYTPRFVHGTGTEKVGLCPICVEPAWRGGEGRNVVRNTKISQYNYHMQYSHGISPKTGLPFSPPIAFRKTKRKKSGVKALEREVVEEGQCHVCRKWIIIESLKLMDVMVPELFWWKHAATCHGTNQLAGDENPYIEDNVYLKLREYEAHMKNSEGVTEELCSQTEMVRMSGPDTPRVGLEAGIPPVVQTGEAVISKNASRKQEGPEVVDEQESSIDLDSDLTDLDVEAERVDMDSEA